MRIDLIDGIYCVSEASEQDMINAAWLVSLGLHYKYGRYYFENRRNCPLY